VGNSATPIVIMADLKPASIAVPTPSGQNELILVIKRVVIDALGDLERGSIDHQRFTDIIYALTQWFAKENVTCLMLYELSHLFEIQAISEQEISNLSDNIVLLGFSHGVEMERTIRVIKTRGSAHDNREHKLSITNKGVIVESARK
jgi:circadian clock protein KaiC